MLKRTITVHTKVPVPTQTVAGVVEIYDDAVPNCAELLSLLDEGAFAPARVGVTDAVGVENPHIRDSSNVFINPFQLNTALEWYELARTIYHYLDSYGRRYDVQFQSMEYFAINRYLPGQRYKAHADAGPVHPRVISALLYMNDVASGGETRFIHHDVQVTPKAGRLIIFPSNYAYAHAALPPADGVKYSLAAWTRT